MNIHVFDHLLNHLFLTFGKNAEAQAGMKKHGRHRNARTFLPDKNNHYYLVMMLALVISIILALMLIVLFYSMEL